MVPIYATLLFIPCIAFSWIPHFLPHLACLLFLQVDTFEPPDVILSAYYNFFTLHLHLLKSYPIKLQNLCSFPHEPNWFPQSDLI